jgi:hypothetical protein
MMLLRGGDFEFCKVRYSKRATQNSKLIGGKNSSDARKFNNFRASQADLSLKNNSAIQPSSNLIFSFLPFQRVELSFHKTLEFNELCRRIVVVGDTFAVVTDAHVRESGRHI